MINKRLLIKNLLAHNDECSFYDKKRQLNLHSKEGKAKFLKHICALSNSNPSNNSYIVVGVEDQDNEIMGDDFFDDSKIQNLVNAYLENPPKIQYENVPFPNKYPITISFVNASKKSTCKFLDISIIFKYIGRKKG
jgi:predicted HTH transcriptional regulator